jgi:hypothetical protein
LTGSMINANPGSHVTVCGNECEFDEFESDKDKFVCTVPSLATTYSVENYGI